MKRNSYYSKGLPTTFNREKYPRGVDTPTGTNRSPWKSLKRMFTEEPEYKVVEKYLSGFKNPVVQWGVGEGGELNGSFRRITNYANRKYVPTFKRGGGIYIEVIDTKLGRPISAIIIDPVKKGDKISESLASSLRYYFKIDVPSRHMVEVPTLEDLESVDGFEGLSLRYAFDDLEMRIARLEQNAQKSR